MYKYFNLILNEKNFKKTIIFRLLFLKNQKYLQYRHEKITVFHFKKIFFNKIKKHQRKRKIFFFMVKKNV